MRALPRDLGAFRGGGWAGDDRLRIGQRAVEVAEDRLESQPVTLAGDGCRASAGSPKLEDSRHSSSRQGLIEWKARTYPP